MLSDIHKVSISQQLSGVIAFDIAVVAQKVKVQYRIHARRTGEFTN